MFPEVLEYASTGLVTTALGTTLSFLAGAGAMLFAAPKLSEVILPSPRETHLSDFLPFDAIAPDGKTVIMKNGGAARYIAVSGYDQSFLTDGEQRTVFGRRKRAIDALAEYNVSMRIYTFRERIPITPAGTDVNPYAAEISRRWNRNFKDAYATRNIICLSTNSPGPAPEFQILEDATNVLLANLKPYGPQVLTQNPKDSETSDLTLGSVLGRLVSPLSRPNPQAFGDELSEVLCADEIEFAKNGRITFRRGDEKRLCSAIGIRRFGDVTNAAMASELSAINADILIFQTIDPYTKFKAIGVLKQNQGMMAPTAFGDTLTLQYQAAISLVDGMDQDKACLCGFSETIFVFAETEEKLKELEKHINQILTNHGITSVIEAGVAQASWFLQYPGYDVKPRSYRLMSTNVAQLAAFDKAASGLPRSSFGDGPLMLFYTGANSVYSHQMHISVDPQALGHAVVIAPSEGGKTTFMEMLSCMATRHKRLKHYFFDRHNGSYIYTTAMGGKYLSFNNEPKEQSIVGGMNPLQCDPTTGNAAFLQVWLRAITKSKQAVDEKEAAREEAESFDQIAAAIRYAFEYLPYERRSLASLYEGAFTEGTRLKYALRKWVAPDQYGPLFNAERDCISLDDNWLTTFDMTKLYDGDDTLGNATVSYVMHRIVETLRRTRSCGFLALDETEPMLKNPDFFNHFMVMLQEFRKLDACVMSVFQRPEALQSTGALQAILTQSATYYLFPNPGAKPEFYSDFDLTPRELGFVLGETQPARQLTRGLLIKRPKRKESVIVDIDLSCLGPYLKLLSSSAIDVAWVNDLQKQFGATWVDKIIHPEAP